jgi:hypothetical protein
MRCALLLFMVGPAAAGATDPALKPLADALAHVRAASPINKERDAGPELTPVKSALRAWVEAKLVTLRPFVPDGQGAFQPSHAEGALAARLNATLQTNGLTCDGGPGVKPRCVETAGDFSSHGYIGGVDLSFLDSNRYLLLETSVGIACGQDQSAYLYEWSGKDWHLLLSSEQDDYRNDKYEPQNFVSVKVSPEKTPPMVLTIGYSPSCASNWQRLYTRLWRTTQTSIVPQPLLDLSQTVYMSDDPIAAASLTAHDLLIEFAGNSIDGNRLVRQHILHYAIESHDELKRIAPVALDPRDFVDEWLTSPWKEAGDWTAPSVSLANYHRTHHADFILGTFTGDATRCAHDQSLWQVGFAMDGEKGDTHQPFYFLVRWLAPYRFTMMELRRVPYAHCNIADKMPDAFGTLFPLQDWRR